MKHSPLKTDVITIIAYSRLVTKQLNSGECIALHQWANLGLEPLPKLQLKVKQIAAEISAKKWERPELKYDENLYLYFYCTKTLKWINTNIN